VNSFLVFENGVGGPFPDMKGTLANQIGLESISFGAAKWIYTRLEALDPHGPQLSSLNLSANCGSPQVECEPGANGATRILKNRGPIIWRTIHRNDVQGDAFYVHNLRDLVRIAEKANRRDDWDRLAQPLDRGSFDAAVLVRTLADDGYRASVGRHSYDVEAGSETNLQPSKTIGRPISAQVAAVSPLVARHEPMPNEQSSQSEDAMGVSTGQGIFKKNCSFCHGADGRGASGPSLVNSVLVKNDANGELISVVVRSGRAAKGMPSFSFSDADMSALVQYLHFSSKLAAQSDNDLATNEKIRADGNADAGKNYFMGSGRCGSCHSPLGDLKGVGSRYASKILEARLIYPSGGKPSVVVTSQQGVVSSGELIYLDEFVVILRDKSEHVRSLSRKTVEVDVKDPLAAHRDLLDKLTDADVHNLLAYLETL
jgi:cytochrome c oxidase cbb3-type subunit 3